VVALSRITDMGSMFKLSLLKKKAARCRLLGYGSERRCYAFMGIFDFFDFDGNNAHHVKFLPFMVSISDNSDIQRECKFRLNGRNHVGLHYRSKCRRMLVISLG
jgi:hypothetical protein